ncbi:MAG: AbrB/MazE/SpoVT family DNA-binding domain-containing protein [Parvularcula sp.]|nr:AbrB/MazE/SpoVT family DNA-binding domain-containing protein [Parvularcula sp.]
MATLQAKVTSKGQVTLPKQIRESLSIRAGDRLEFSLEPSNKISVRKKRKPGSSAGCAKHLIKPGQKPLTTEQMDDAIRDHMRKKYSYLIEK